MTVIITEFEKSQMKDSLPELNVGDTIEIHKLIVEGKKERIQRFEGILIKKTGKYSRESVTVRKIIDKIGVEKTYLLHSPTLKEIKVIKRGKVRRSRLYYLRDRVGAKATRVKSAETV